MPNISDMRKPPIIIIINKKPYVINMDKIETIRAIPREDRQQLITLLDIIKSEEKLVQVSDQSVSTITSSVANIEDTHAPEHTKLENDGNVDAVMAQLIMEEDHKKKENLSKQLIYKWMMAVAVIIFLLILVL